MPEKKINDVGQKFQGRKINKMEISIKKVEEKWTYMVYIESETVPDKSKIKNLREMEI